MALTEDGISRCEQCDAPLARVAGMAGCLNCLLRGGLRETEGLNRRFQHYEVSLSADGITLRELGRGAMGITYHAVDTNLGCPVALKVISERYSQDEQARKRFRREARAAAQLRHPNVATVFHFGQTAEGRCFYAMELVEGETLEARVRRDGPLPVSAVLDIGEQIAQALVAAEKHGLVHRDLKPSNIMVLANDADPSNRLPVKVIDFGLARPVVANGNASGRRHQGFSGTPGFASPEQLAGELSAGGGLDSRSDIYSLGATLWYLLCGEPPFAGQTLAKIRMAQTHPLPLERLALARVPHPVATLLCSMLSVDPAERPQSARQLLARLRQCREAVQAPTARRRLLQWAALALLVIGAFGLAGHLWLRSFRPQSSSTALATPGKSIAVLPFENLSNDPEDSFFADGVQDDIVTKLAKIRDLKVISRASAMQYRGETNMRAVGSALGVAYALQGSVRKNQTQVHLNAHLIDTRTDSHVWAEQYDCDLNSIFAVQSEIALKVADQLHARLSAAERLDMARPPTADLAAFELYTHAKNLLLMTSFSGSTESKLLQAADLLNRAVAQDPEFFQAYCLLSRTHHLLYFLGFDPTPARRALAQSAVEAAVRLRPDSGEAHLARAENLYRGYLDYNGAMQQLDIARKALPNDPTVFELQGYIERRRGKQHRALQSLERAVELDPRNFFTLQQIAASYHLLRRYADERVMLERALAVRPGDLDTRIERAYVELDWKADTKPLHELIDAIRTREPAAIKSVADAWLTCALCERDAEAARSALAATDQNALSDDIVHFSRPFVEGVIARMIGDEEQARAAFAAARLEQEKMLQERPNYAPLLCVLGLIDAAMGRKQDALQEGQRAVRLLSVDKDAINGPHMIGYLAMIAAWAGDKDLACQHLEVAVRPPSSITYGQLKLLPFWDPLRGHPRFEKIVASLAPAERH